MISSYGLAEFCLKSALMTSTANKTAQKKRFLCRIEDECVCVLKTCPAKFCSCKALQGNKQLARSKKKDEKQ